MTEEQKRTGAPEGAQTDAAAGSNEPAEPGEVEFEEMSEDEAWKAFPKQVQAAITYAQSNTYDYGPRLRNTELDYTVLSARPMTDEITRVVLSYQPKARFKGDAGSEYLDVDRNGVVQARRQIRVPKETMPWLLIGLATLSVIAAVVLVPVIFLIEEQADPTYVAGRTLWVRSEQPRIGAYLYYHANDSNGTPRTWIVVPEGEETEIAWVNLVLINQTSGVVNLAIDDDAVEITTEDGVLVRPINVVERVEWPVEGETLDPRLNIIGLPLWGDRTLQSDQQLEGFVAFEIPRGSEIASLRWAATDVANIRY